MHERQEMHCVCDESEQCTQCLAEVADYRPPPRPCCRQMEEPRASPRPPRSRSRPRGATAVAAATAPCASASGGAADGAAGDAVDKA